MSLRLRPASCVLLSVLAFLSQRHLFKTTSIRMVTNGLSCSGKKMSPGLQCMPSINHCTVRVIASSERGEPSLRSLGGLLPRQELEGYS